MQLMWIYPHDRAVFTVELFDFECVLAVTDDIVVAFIPTRQSGKPGTWKRSDWRKA